MSRLLRIFLTIFLAGSFALTFTRPVHAIPSLPSSFYGKVKFNNANVADGTSIRALINGKVVAYGFTQTYQGESVYTLDIPSDDAGTSEIEGGREQDVIHFDVGGVLAEQTGIWHGGTNVNLDLSVISEQNANTPGSTPLPPPTQTAIPRPLPTSTKMPPTASVQPISTAVENVPSVSSPTAMGLLMTTGVSTEQSLTQSKAVDQTEIVPLTGNPQADSSGDLTFIAIGLILIIIIGTFVFSLIRKTTP